MRRMLNNLHRQHTEFSGITAPKKIKSPLSQSLLIHKQIEAPRSKLRGIFDRKEVCHFQMRSLTPQQAAGNALAFAVQLRDTSGDLNFHDALIASGCRDLGLKWIATFDSDFDQIKWLKRLYNSEGVREAFQKSSEPV